MRNRLGEIWELLDDVAILLVIGEVHVDVHGDLCHPCVDILTSETDDWYEDEEWEEHPAFRRLA